MNTFTFAKINERAMLVYLSMRVWTARKYDRKVSAKVADEYKADRDAGRYNKLLIAKDAIKQIEAVRAKARAIHYKYTLPWLDTGDRILPAAMYMDYTREMAECRREFEQQVKQFLPGYPDLVTDAHGRLKGMWNADDYPSAEAIASKFGFQIVFSPMPQSEDFRCTDLDGASSEDIQKTIDNQVKDALSNATSDIWHRIFESVSHMKERLNKYNPDDKKSAPFRDSVVKNLRELVDLLPKLNITGDARLERMRKELKKSLIVHDAEDLRADNVIREDTAKKADALLEKMKGYI